MLWNRHVHVRSDTDSDSEPSRLEEFQRSRRSLLYHYCSSIQVMADVNKHLSSAPCSLTLRSPELRKLRAMDRDTAGGTVDSLRFQ